MPSDDEPAAGPQSPLPEISLPKGGGAIQGIGEKFSTNSMTGTGAMSIPIAITPARSGFGPRLSLTYDSGGGNGVFGMGWSLALPEITRKTDKGLPRYRDAEESDVFILSGSEDLVPVLRGDGGGEWRLEDEERDGYWIRQYRPRVEGLFARIERWTRQDDGEIHWRSFSRDDILTVYGGTPESRISDPDHPLHIFRWLISASYDAKGNAVVYQYRAEDDQCVDPAERRRRGVNRYPKRILYGNRKPLERGRHVPEDSDWMFEVVFDYGDEDYRVSRNADGEECVSVSGARGNAEWPAREDSFSTYRSGFEIRTRRLCHRTLVFHRFPDELETGRYLVRSTGMEYRESRTGTLLTGAVQSGYTLLADGWYLRKSLPRVDLAYTHSPLAEESPGPFELKEAESRGLPEGIEGAYRWIDLNGEGISGVLSEQGPGWYYKRNLGSGRFGEAQLIRRKPASARLSPGRQQLLDVGGKGQVDLVDLGAGSSGFYERTHPEDSDAGLQSGWGRFRPFRAVPVVDWNDPNLRFVDLTGDGIADVLVTEDVAFRWYPSCQSEGFGAAVRIPAPGDEEDGPRVVFSDPTQTIFLADMSGDGLTDIVRIRNGETCYWPNLGYGHFGSKILMGRSPWFEEPGLFDAGRIRLADTDGSGTTDILYLANDTIHVYLNESGNSLSAPRTLRGLPPVRTNSISVVDFLGRGTACLVWSSPLPADAQRPLRYVDLMRGRKPHLLTRVANNLGAETAIEYASSTEFYLADEAAGRPWVTPLPFAVHVVKRVETYDFVSQTRVVTSQSYHHGYYDGVEREFRGFGRIDRIDSEGFENREAGRSYPAAVNEDAAWRVAPILTKTWYHTGVFQRVDRVSRHLAHEYYREPGEDSGALLDDTVLPSELAPEEAREACRALKGSVLHQEVYALDGGEESGRPYTVSDSNSTIRMFQPRGPNLHGVFFTHARETLKLNYERKLYEIGESLRADPRVDHSVNLKVDDYGNVLEAADIAYGRRYAGRSILLAPDDRTRQAELLATATIGTYTNAVHGPSAYRTPAPAGTSVYELIHLDCDLPRDGEGQRRIGFSELLRQVARAGDGFHDLPYQDVHATGATGPGPYRRLIQKSRTRYRSNDLERLLPPGRLESLALIGESYSLAFTPGLIGEVFLHKAPETEHMLHGEGGYRDLDGDGGLWIPSGRVFYSPDAGDGPAEELRYARRHFFLPHRFRDPFGNTGSVVYDKHDLAPVEARDAAGNVTQARLDYRVMQPRRVTDPNGNRTEAAFDAMGMVAGTAVMGKAGEHAGDSLDGFVADLPERVVLEHLCDPLANPQAILGKATTRLLYDLFAFDRTRAENQPQPAAIYTMARETHVPDLAAGEQTKVQHSFSYSDGFAREIQKKVQAEPGPIPGYGSGKHDPRWIGSGWTIFNNRNKPVRQYEPFFSKTHRFEFAAKVGVATILIYDPVDRVVATLNPNHTFQKTVIDPWSQQSWDVNDTVLLNPGADPDIGPLLRLIPKEEYLPTWYDERHNGAAGRAEQEAAGKAALHAGTPAAAFFDPKGRTVLSVTQNRFRRGETLIDESYPTRTDLDIQGNQLSVTDALGRVIMSYDYDLSRNKLRMNSPDAGERWMLGDIAGRPILALDSRGFRLRYEYDVLRRPTALHVSAGAGPERLAERTEYGESQPDAAAHNLRTKVFRQFDEAGVATTPLYDFKGNLLRGTRQVLAGYRGGVDWNGSPALEAEVFVSETAYDALNRPTALTAPDQSIIRPDYNQSSLLDRLEVSLKGPHHFAPYIDNIEYNAKGQRVRIDYGNGARSASAYDPLTFRLISLRTTRTTDGARLQDFAYTYDPVGNLSSIADSAQETAYFDNQAVSARGDYVYDAIYRLIGAAGREHAGNPEHPETSWDDAPRVHLPLPGDGQAMRRYHEQYRYDAAGNILELWHAAGSAGSWRRHYEYAEAAADNRLSQTTVGQEEERYSYDADGNMTRMPHLASMTWDFRNRLASTQAQLVRNGGQAETTYYVYNSGGERVRKVTTGATGHRRADRIYLSGFEIYREYGGDGETLALDRTTLHVMDGERRAALIETRGDETTVRYQFDNHLGSSCVELDDQAAVITYEEYYPFGSTSYQAGRSVAEVSLKRYRFTGRERDNETGFTYHGARYYAPWLGRWTSCDPSGIDDGVNVFAYVNNNPVNKVDLTGNFEMSWTHLAIGVGVAVLAVGAVALTAGLAGPGVVAGIATFTGLSEATVTTGIAVAGTSYGAYSTVKSVGEIRQEIQTGTNKAGEKVSDAQISEEIGGTAVGAIATLLGVKGINVSGGGPPQALAPEGAEALADFFAPSLGIPRFAVSASPQTAVIGLSSGLAVNAPILMNAIGGGGPGSSGGGGGGSGGSGGGRRLFPNQSPETLQAELEAAAELGVQPIEPTDPKFADIANSGRIKWAITQDGKLLVIPHTVDGEEISHAVITRGGPVLAAGEADIAVAPNVSGKAVGAEITPRSGHFMFGNDEAANDAVEQLGREAFRQFGIEFPKSGK